MRAEMVLTRPVVLTEADADLVRRMGERDESALRDLGVTYGRRMLAYACRLTGSLETAEEVVQDALFAAWQRPASFRGDGRVVAWLLGITRNQALNAVRRKRLPLAPLDDAEGLRSAQPGPDAAAERAEQGERMRRALDSLTADHRETLELVFYQGLTLAEVAEVCRCPVGTVKSRLNHAKLRLRAALGAVDSEPSR